MKRIQWILVSALLLQHAHGETIEKSGRFGGVELRYKVILPKGYNPARAWPVILAFTGGGQTMTSVDRMLDRNWAQAEQRGYIVVSPAAPGGQLFFQGGNRVFPAFLDQILRDYPPQGGKLHIAGPSNGGISAFHIAAMYPRYFASVTGYPGYLPEDERAEALRPMCIFMHVGELDTPWLNVMRRQSDSFRRSGLRVRFTVERGQEHLIGTLTSGGAGRLFDQIEEAAKGCN
jgi:poly(3-hydroxybutyrate) depolymerase